MSDSSDDEITLSIESMNALKEFLKEREETIQKEQETKEIQEDWQLSQFWYAEETSEHVAKVLETEAGESSTVVCLSTPSIYKVLDKYKSTSKINSILFEYDKRFSCYGDSFSFYDYNQPLNVPKELVHQVDYICLDPPFLSEECLEKVVETIKLLSKGPQTKLLLMTGRIQWPHIQRLLPEMKICKFEPKHPRLQNDFFACCNYDSKLLN